MSVSPLLAALRQATGDIHDDLERAADVEGGLRAADTRASVVGRLLDLHRAGEAALTPWRAALDRMGLAFQPRAALIAKDLAALDGRAPVDTPRARIASLGEAVGWVYVLEGSMLGGRVMLKAMRRDGLGLEGLAFLDPHGDQTGPRWQAFLHALDRAGASGAVSEADVVAGGRAAFELARRLLVPERAVGVAA